MRYPTFPYTQETVGKCKLLATRSFFSSQGFEENNCSIVSWGTYFIRPTSQSQFIMFGLQGMTKSEPHPIIFCGYSCHFDVRPAVFEPTLNNTRLSAAEIEAAGFKKVTTVAKANALEEYIVTHAPSVIARAEETLPAQVDAKFPHVAPLLAEYLPRAREYGVRLMAGEKQLFDDEVWRQADYYSASAQIGGKAEPFRNIYRFALAVIIQHSEEIERVSWAGYKAYVPGMPIEEGAGCLVDDKFIEGNKTFMHVFQALVSQILWSSDHHFDELVIQLHDPNPEWLSYSFEEPLARANREKLG